MKCPMLMDKTLLGGDCVTHQCAWWEEHFGRCAILVEAYLKGRADHRLEVKESLIDRHWKEG